MTTNASNYLENKIVEHVLRNVAFTSPTNVYVSLHTADPTEVGNVGEVSGGSYVRKSATFAAASNGAVATSAALTWTGMPAATVSHVAIHDASTAGNCLYYGPATTSRTLQSGDSYTIAIGALTVTHT